jgi:hypothetical protein
VFSEDVDALKAKRICFACVGEEYLGNEIRAKGKRAKCSYCVKMRHSYSVDEVAERAETAFEQHYIRTSDQPDNWQDMLLRDRESSYEWYRNGEPVTDAIMNAADIPQEAAEDIQKILEDKHDDMELAKMGEETEFAEDSHYEERVRAVRLGRKNGATSRILLRPRRASLAARRQTISPPSLTELTCYGRATAVRSSWTPGRQRISIPCIGRESFNLGTNSKPLSAGPIANSARRQHSWRRLVA